MNRSKSRARAKAATDALLSSMTSAPPSPTAGAPAAAKAPAPAAPPTADAMRLLDLLDAHLDRLQGVRSVMWAMTALLENVSRTGTLPRAAGFELLQLARTGLGLAGEAMDALTVERCGVGPVSCH